MSIYKHNIDPAPHREQRQNGIHKDAQIGVSINRLVPRVPFQHKEAGRDVLEERWRAIVKLRHKVVEMHAAMILLQHDLRSLIQETLPAMGDVLSKRAKTRKTNLEVRVAELFEHFACLRTDFLCLDGIDELSDGVGRQHIVTNHEKVVNRRGQDWANR